MQSIDDDKDEGDDAGGQACWQIKGNKFDTASDDAANDHGDDDDDADDGVIIDELRSKNCV